MQSYTTEMSQETRPASAPLVERVDSSIGEASTMIGAMLTEFMRRTLRNGVIKIDEEMNSFVGEKVDATIAERTPALEQHAVEVAENTARAAATEVAVQEVTVLRETTTKTARELAGQIQDVDKRAQQTTEQTAERLTGRIDETDKRVGETTQEIKQQVQDLWHRSREGAASFKTRLKELEEALERSRAEIQRLRERDEANQQSLEEMTARIVELERPRGLRALWARLFGRKKKAA
jgi:chromosome segregation ATPase